MKQFVFYALLAAATLLPVPIAEFFLRQVGLGYPLIYESDFAFGYALRPNQKTLRFRDAYVTINESGLRSLDPWVGKFEKRILFLGDSVTYGGSKIDDTETFAHLFCETKRKHLENIVCGNAGVNGYGVLSMVLRSRFDERIGDADLAIFTVVARDFVRGIPKAKYAHFFMKDNDWWLPAIAEAVNYLASVYDINNLTSKEVRSPQHDLQAAAFAIERLRDEIGRLQGTGTQVYLVYSPTRKELSSQNDLAKFILSGLQDIDVKLIQLSGVLKDDDEHYYDGVHYERGGHRAVADALSRHILTE